MRKTPFYGWTLLAAFWGLYFVNQGLPTYGSSVLNAFMAESLGLDRQMLGTAFSLFLVMVGLPGPLVAWSVNRFGVRATLMIGSLSLLAGCLFMMFVASTGWHAVFGFGFLMGLGACAGAGIPQQAGIARWFSKRRATALSIFYTSGGIAGFLAAPALTWVVERMGGNWRMGWAVVAVMAILACLAAFFFVKENPSDLGQTPDGAPEQELHGPAAGATRKGSPYRTAEEWTFREAVRTRTLWMLVLASIGISMGFGTWLPHGVPHLRDLGHSAAAAAIAMSTMSICTLIGKLAGSVGDRIDPRYLWATSMVLFGIGMIYATRATGTADLYLVGMLLGIGWGGTLVSMMTVPVNYYGPRAYASLVGIMMAIQTTSSAVAPIVAGYWFDTYGTYAPVFYVLAGMCFLGSCILMLASPPRRMAGAEALSEASMGSGSVPSGA